MSDQRQEIENGVVQLVTTVLVEYMNELADRGLAARPQDIARLQNEGRYSSEVRIYIEKDGQIEDVLEFFVFENDVLAATNEEIETWLRAELSAL